MSPKLPSTNCETLNHRLLIGQELQDPLHGILWNQNSKTTYVESKKKETTLSICSLLNKIRFEAWAKMGQSGEKLHISLPGLSSPSALAGHHTGTPRMEGREKDTSWWAGRKEAQGTGTEIVLIPFYSTSIPSKSVYVQSVYINGWLGSVSKQ